MVKNVVVIGGGVVGLTTAWTLLERGHKVRLVEREFEVASGSSRANGGQLSYRYVSPLADAGVPAKALRWLLDIDGPLRFKPEARLQQWSWLARFLWACRGSVNRRTTERLLELGAYSQRAFAALSHGATLGGFELRAPGKLVIYRQPAEFKRVAARSGTGIGAERALDSTECIALEPALGGLGQALAGGIYTPGEAVADCRVFCEQLAQRIGTHPGFGGFVRASAQGFVLSQGRAVALRSNVGEIEGSDFIIAAGLHSRALAQTVGLSLPIYPLKGYSLSAPVGPRHRPPEVSVTDFEKKVLYARIGSQLRVAAMVDLVGEDASIDPRRIDSLLRSVRTTMPEAADYDRAEPWAGLRPATPDGAPIVGATRVPGLWLNAGHGALGFTFAAGTAGIVAALVSGEVAPMPLDGLSLACA